MDKVTRMAIVVGLEAQDCPSMFILCGRDAKFSFSKVVFLLLFVAFAVSQS
jgi:hypothetical protein